MLAWSSAVPEGRVHAEVPLAWITLRGDVNWDYQLGAAEDAVRNLVGVRGITNDIVIMWHHDQLGRPSYPASAR